MITNQWDGAPTEDEVVDFCLRFRPDLAAARSDSSLCVTPLITRMTVNGDVVELQSRDDRWLGHEVRVSGERQRSGRARTEQSKKKNYRQKDEGFSEEEQLRRGIRYCLQHRLAYKIYSDAGVTGEFPNNDAALIQKLLKKKAARYRRIFTKVLLDDTSLLRRSASEITSMRKYLENRCAAILRGGITEEEAYEPTEDEEQIRFLRLRRGRPRKRVYYRQGFSQLWTDIEANQLHLVTACESSRMCRDADLHIAFLQLLHEHDTQVHGLVEQMLSLDVGDPLNKGVLYFLASHHEARLIDTATATFRGSVQRLESGRHTGKLPWWIKADDEGYPQLVTERLVIVQKILDLYLAGHGTRHIENRLLNDGNLVAGKPLTIRQIVDLLEGDTVGGTSRMYGLEWNVLPAAITDEGVLGELRAVRDSRKHDVPQAAPKFWSEHLFTGLCRCSCGRSMQHQHVKRMPNNPDGIYRCTQRHGKARGSHASVDAHSLAEFFGELVSCNPHLLSGALAESLCPGSTEERAARRSLLEATLKAAEERYNDAKRVARTKAEATACGLGMAAGSEGFDLVVEGLAKSDLRTASAELDQLRSEIARLRAESSRRKRDDNFLASLAELGQWRDLDTSTRNRLLRSVFEEITVYPRLAEDKIEIKLHGLTKALAPLHRIHTNRNDFRLPTVGEWLEDACSPERKHAGAPPSVHNMRPLTQVRGELAHVEGVEDFWKFCRANEIRVNNQATLKTCQKKLAAKGADAHLMTVLKNVYEAYVEIERVRLSESEPSPAQ